MPLGPEDLLTVGEVSRRTGVSVSALHFYENQGLIFAERTSGNQRRYPRHMLRRISLLLVAKRLGIPLAEVAELFAELPRDRVPKKRDWDRISRHWRSHLEARRQEIERLESELAGCIGCGCLSMSRCRLLNPADKLGKDGSGARLLMPLEG
ncbi:redox-sensitive transcriptional activator SoxR [Psychromicrobium sp. YIM B11713]|uniref:redox-sensitive transcriptional activator SoxR n=1 Tax=Psychromicrobium sp. YIM B11713 TaxID=3145233 RepID=UPI00374F2BE7